jgi:hypothetical protein
LLRRQTVSLYRGDEISVAAKFLVDFLNDTPRHSLPYSLFYDGSDDVRDVLFVEMDVGSYITERAIALAGAQLAEAGLIRIHKLEERLPNGECDYLMELTIKGQEFARNGNVLACRDVEQ